jgi:hypothetical protein
VQGIPPLQNWLFTLSYSGNPGANVPDKEGVWRQIPSQMYTPPVVDYSADVAGAKEEEAEDYHKELDVQTTTTV